MVRSVVGPEDKCFWGSRRKFALAAQPGENTHLKQAITLYTMEMCSKDGEPMNLCVDVMCGSSVKTGSLKFDKDCCIMHLVWPPYTYEALIRVYMKRMAYGATTTTTASQSTPLCFGLFKNLTFNPHTHIACYFLSMPHSASRQFAYLYLTQFHRIESHLPPVWEKESESGK